MKRKQGISLIVLVITIIVMIILAATVVIALNNTGIIEKANHAVQLTDEKQVQELASVLWAEAYLDPDREDDMETVVKRELDKQGVTETDWNINVTDTGVTVTKKEDSTNNDSTTPVYQLSGTWTFNETLTQTGWASGDTSKYELIDFTLTVDDNVLDRNVFEYGVRDMYGCVYFSMHFNGAESGHVYSQYHWSSQSYGGCSVTTQAGWHSYFANGCIVNFGDEPQTVSEEFYNWFTTNATPQ